MPASRYRWKSFTRMACYVHCLPPGIGHHLNRESSGWEKTVKFRWQQDSSVMMNFRKPAGLSGVRSAWTLFGAALLLLSVPAFPESRDEQGNTHRPFLAQIEAAFTANDPDRVIRLLSSREKTIIVLPELYETGGVFGSSQARFIIKKIFSRYSTLAFRIESEYLASPQGNLTQVRCRWDLKPRDSSDPLHRVLFLRLRREEQRWVVSEIRSARAGPKRGR